jgi:hypothetical protein
MTQQENNVQLSNSLKKNAVICMTRQENKDTTWGPVISLATNKVIIMPSVENINDKK